MKDAISVAMFVSSVYLFGVFLMRWVNSAVGSGMERR